MDSTALAKLQVLQQGWERYKALSDLSRREFGQIGERVARGEILHQIVDDLVEGNPKIIHLGEAMSDAVIRGANEN